MLSTDTTTRAAAAGAARRNVTLRDEFGASRGQPLLVDQGAAIAPHHVDKLGRVLSHRRVIAFQIACR